MRILLNITRIIVGVLFIFSGLVKANDPLGLEAATLHAAAPGSIPAWAALGTHQQ